MAIDGMGAKLADSRITRDEAKAIVAQARADGNPEGVRDRIAESLADHVADPKDRLVLAQQIMDISGTEAAQDVLVIRFPESPANASPVSGAPGPHYGVTHTGSLSVGDRASAVRSAITKGDIASARLDYEQGSPADRSRIACLLLKDPDPKVRQAGQRLLAADPDLQSVLAAAPSVTELRELTNGVSAAAEAGIASKSGAPLSNPEALAAKKALTTFFVAHPEKLDQLWNTPTPTTPSTVEDRQRLAKLVLPGFAEQAKPTYANYQRLIHLAEDHSPNASKKDIVRTVRRCYYTDEQLSLPGGIGVGKHEPQNVDGLSSSLNPSVMKKRWQDIPGPDGQTTDVAHSIVALDAYMNGGPKAAAMFTDWGDSGQELISKATYIPSVWMLNKALGGKISAGGDGNESDAKGNMLGRKLVIAHNSNPSAPLSSNLASAPAVSTAAATLVY